MTGLLQRRRFEFRRGPVLGRRMCLFMNSRASCSDGAATGPAVTGSTGLEIMMEGVGTWGEHLGTKVPHGCGGGAAAAPRSLVPGRHRCARREEGVRAAPGGGRGWGRPTSPAGTLQLRLTSSPREAQH